MTENRGTADLPERGVVETASDFLRRRAGKARPVDMLPFLDKAMREKPPVGDAV